MCVLSRVQLFAIPWTVAGRAPLSMEFSRQEYWSGLPFPSPGGVPDLGLEPVSLMFLALAGKFFTTEPPGKPEQRSGMLLNILQCTEYHSPPPTKAYPVQNVSNHEAEQHGPEMFHIWRPRSLEAPALPHSSTF